jgi:stage II sporulation protein D
MSVGIRFRLATLLLALASSTSSAQDIRIGVFGLFHPTELTVSSTAGSELILHIEGQGHVLDAGSSFSTATVKARGVSLVVHSGPQILTSRKFAVTGRDDGPADFLLSVPGRIARHYRGRLAISNSSGVLVPVVAMDLENAVASVVAAEGVSGESLEALKAQAVAARSYFVAGKGRHQDFDFCDTTHCQFLREPPLPPSVAFKAAVSTRGLVLAFHSQVFAAMYTRSCSGHTRTPAQVGLPSGSYPYYSVECRYCRQHPSPWRSRISAGDAVGLHPSDEPARLGIARKLGWSTVPSSDFTIKVDGEWMVLDGVGHGHGIGLCQAGAKAMALEGASFRQILVHYFPNAELAGLSH